MVSGALVMLKGGGPRMAVITILGEYALCAWGGDLNDIGLAALGDSVESKVFKLTELEVLNVPRTNSFTGDELPPLPELPVFVEGELEDLRRRFTYHAPKEGQPAQYEAIRREAGELAVLVTSLCPPGRGRALALTKIEEAVFWANASIARS